MRNAIAAAKTLAVNMIYPGRCPVCDRIVTPAGEDICRECIGELSTIDSIYCLKCGRPLKNEADVYCKGCMEKEHDFEYCRAAFVYNDAMRRSIYRFKYDGRREYSAFYGRAMISILGDKLKSVHADAIIPVPMYKKKEKARGYNQAYLLAKELSNHLKIPIYDDIIYREKSTTIMRSLGAAQRENNIKSAFIIGHNDVKLYDVIIVDDIYTTGSTMDAVSRSLKGRGVRNVYGFCLSSGSTEL